MARWIRFAHAGEVGFGTLEDDTILVHEGDMFAGPVATSRSLGLDQVEVLTPTQPGKMIALWNNFHAMAEKARLSIPEDPLYFIKADTSYLATGQVIRRPKAYSGRVVYEGSSASSSAGPAVAPPRPRPPRESSATLASTTSPPSTC